MAMNDVALVAADAADAVVCDMCGDDAIDMGVCAASIADAILLLLVLFLFLFTISSYASNMSVCVCMCACVRECDTNSLIFDCCG